MKEVPRVELSELINKATDLAEKKTKMTRMLF